MHPVFTLQILNTNYSISLEWFSCVPHLASSILSFQILSNPFRFWLKTHLFLVFIGIHPSAHSNKLVTTSYKLYLVLRSALSFWWTVALLLRFVKSFAQGLVIVGLRFACSEMYRYSSSVLQTLWASNSFAQWALLQVKVFVGFLLLILPIVKS